MASSTTKKRSKSFEVEDEPLDETESLAEIISIMESLDPDAQQGVIGFLRGRFPRGDE